MTEHYGYKALSILQLKNILLKRKKLVPGSSAPGGKSLTDLEITCKQKMLVPHIRNP